MNLLVATAVALLLSDRRDQGARCSKPGTDVIDHRIRYVASHKLIQRRFGILDEIAPFPACLSPVRLQCGHQAVGRAPLRRDEVCGIEDRRELAHIFRARPGLAESFD
ncbi:hypothetical protein LP421_11410 [Rhizobium sp. RCAM05350]|nr:hypothetical protein LP421_11410 [Rhizobium sp. RCAM05350]